VSAAVFRAMLLSLLRDRGALLMSFFLPALFFVVMAEIFTATTGENLSLHVAVYDEVRSDASSRLLKALAARPNLKINRTAAASRRAIKTAVRSGTADVGLIIRADAALLDGSGSAESAPLLLVFDPARGVARRVLTGEIRRAYASALPEVIIGNMVAELESRFLTLSEIQRQSVATGLETIRDQAKAGETASPPIDSLIVDEAIVGGESANLVAYSAGAVAFMFLLFASVHSAISLLEEQESGILDRVLAGPGGITVLVNGKFAYVVFQGFVQVSVIFLVAWLAYGVDLPSRWLDWLIVTLAAAISAAGLAMLLATACQTRRQAQTVANTAILVLSALGGSMVPRFLMPETLQDLGWLTPNTWALEAYSGVFWRQEPLQTLLEPLALLLLVGLSGWLIALQLAKRKAYAAD